MRAIQRRQAVAKGTQRKCWRKSNRNAVMRLALMKRPTTEHAREVSPDGCVLCGADSSHLHVQEREAYKTQPFTLTWLGIKAPRWVRGTKETVCQSCGTSYSDGKMHSWNIAKSNRRYADFGQMRFPMPYEKLKKSLKDTVCEQLRPKKRKLIDRKMAHGMLNKPKRLGRLRNWVRSQQGLLPREDY